MDDMFGAIVVFVAGSILAAIGAAHLAMDFRHFDVIEIHSKDQW